MPLTIRPIYSSIYVEPVPDPIAAALGLPMTRDHYREPVDPNDPPRPTPIHVYVDEDDEGAPLLGMPGGAPPRPVHLHWYKVLVANQPSDNSPAPDFEVGDYVTMPCNGFRRYVLPDHPCVIEAGTHNVRLRVKVVVGEMTEDGVPLEPTPTSPQ